MIKHDLLSAFRSIRKRPGYALLNAGGLGVGLASVFFIALFVLHELSFDRFHENSDNIYRLIELTTETAKPWAPIGYPVGPAVKSAFPEVRAVTRFFPDGTVVVKKGDIQFRESNFAYADSNYFDVFTYDVFEGNPKTALSQVQQLAISESTALKYFGRTDVVGEALIIYDIDFFVSAVFRDLPAATHQPVDILMSLTTFRTRQGDGLDSAWTWNGFHTYLLLDPGASATELESKLPALIDRLMQGEYTELPSTKVSFHLQPLTDIHLYSDVEKEYRTNGNMIYVIVFSLAALFILGIAIVNFINLSTARATTRMFEIGVRKSFGAQRSAIVRQFMVESILHSVLGLCIAVLLVLVLLPAFRTLSEISVEPAYLLRPEILLGIISLTLVTGVLAGFYPAIVLSGFRAIDSFQASRGGTKRGVLLRKALVIFQFSISIVLITLSLFVWKQLSFMRSAELGFDKENVVAVRLVDEMNRLMNNSPDLVRDKLLIHSDIIAVARAGNLPGVRIGVNEVSLEGQDAANYNLRVAWGIDYDYVDALGLEVVEGRAFSREAPRDSMAWLLNEAAVERMGLRDPTSRILTLGGFYKGPIVGVVKNFNFASLRDAIEPLSIALSPWGADNLAIRYSSAQAPSVLEHVRRVFDELAPGSLFEYTFLADQVDAQYRQEDRLANVIAYFSLLGIFVACLGIFGLAAFSASQRTREIGVRKVLGASVSQIIGLLSRETLTLVFIASIASIPLAYFLLDKWLDNFAYRISVSPVLFVAIAFGVLFIALLTVGAQAWRAAVSDPVKAIRSE